MPMINCSEKNSQYSGTLIRLLRLDDVLDDVRERENAGEKLYNTTE